MVKLRQLGSKYLINSVIKKEAVRMGIYLNPGYRAFQMAYNSEIFVDKTKMILHTNAVVNTSQRFMSVSRPRRFGKSYAADMLSAYYGRGNSAELFSRCKISGHENWDENLGKYDVIRLVMTDFFKYEINVSDAIQKIITRVVDEFAEVYPDVRYDLEDLSFSTEKYYRKSGRQFVVIIDEWDAVFRICKEDKKGQKKYLDFLRDWMKDKEYIALAYMTGILPIKKYGEHSALNMFTEYSMTSPMQLASFTGFTVDEVKKLCDKYNMRYEDIRVWYDGYTVSDAIDVEMRKEYREGKYTGHRISIYNPLSVVTAVSTGHIKNYWTRTETYEALEEFIGMNQAGLKDAVVYMMEGNRLAVDVSTYQNDMTTFNSRDDVLTILIHLGYLAYDDLTGEVYIPNKEIKEEFKRATRSEEWFGVMKAMKTSEELLSAILAMDAEKTADLMELAHDRAGNKTYNDEAALSYGIQYALYAAQKYYTTIQELDTGKGYADLVYLPSPKKPDKPALLMELKYDKDVKTAAEQVRARNYPQILEHYAGNILVVSVNYDKDAKGEGFKRHSCSIEKV